MPRARKGNPVDSLVAGQKGIAAKIRRIRDRRVLSSAAVNGWRVTPLTRRAGCAWNRSAQQVWSALRFTPLGIQMITRCA
jgi:hypothetical protein